jgi:glycosyltransferase involved in cell wall biosynthesis
MEENKELISIVVPVYNEGAHIRKSMDCVEEICNNAGILYELVLIDDGSRIIPGRSFTPWQRKIRG